MALQIMERREDFPGVTRRAHRRPRVPAAARRQRRPRARLPRPGHRRRARGPRAARTPSAGAKNETVLQRTDLIGRTGLERQYDDDLRGTPGVKTLAVDHQGGVSGVLSETAADRRQLPGHHDRREGAGRGREAAARPRSCGPGTTGDINKGYATKLKADSGAVVVMDVRTGGIVAMASWPTYDPNIWVGGISTKDYKSITSKKNNYPNQSRAFQGEFAPASTFKAVIAAGGGEGRLLAARLLRLPVGVLRSAGRRRRNYESQGYGVISMHRAIQVSCDTVFYKFAYETWLREGGLHAEEERQGPVHRDGQGASGSASRPGSTCPASRTAGSPTGPGSAPTGRPPRTSTAPRRRPATRRSRSKDPRARRTCCSCRRRTASTAGPTAAVTRRTSRSGRATRTTTPLQMARVYAAVANGGTLVTPHIGRAVITPEGELVRADRAGAGRPGPGQRGRR